MLSDNQEISVAKMNSGFLCLSCFWAIFVVLSSKVNSENTLSRLYAQNLPGVKLKTIDQIYEISPGPYPSIHKPKAHLRFLTSITWSGGSIALSETIR